MTTRTFTVRVSDSAGNETVGTVNFETGGETILTGDVGGLIPAGSVARFRGLVNFLDDLIIEGHLTSDESGVVVEGNQHQLLVQNGGTTDIQGVAKSGWVPFGGTPVNWQTGDRIAIAPTVAGVYVPSTFTWNGWGTRPVNSPTVTLPNGVQVEAEVANLTRSITLKNLSRIHFHDGAGVQTLKHLAILNSGITGVLSQYPLHFHHCGESVRGSLVEGVVVEGGKNHAFVPHDSHGVIFRDCVAYNTFQDAYWWDLPPNPGDTFNNSHDIIYDHCLAMYVRPAVGQSQTRLTGFLLSGGLNPSVTDSVATCVQGTTQASGFQWPEQVSDVWTFHHNTFHNNKINGIFVWQNDFDPHVVEDFIGYHNGVCQIDHGAYGNVYKYRRGVLMGGLFAVRMHAVNAWLLEDVVADTRLLITKHRKAAVQFAIVRNCSFGFVSYNEFNDGGVDPSKIRYEDCGLVPADFFTMHAAIPATVAEIYEAGVLLYRWTAGGWT